MVLTLSLKKMSLNVNKKLNVKKSHYWFLRKQNLDDFYKLDMLPSQSSMQSYFEYENVIGTGEKT